MVWLKIAEAASATDWRKVEVSQEVEHQWSEECGQVIRAHVFE